MDIKTIISITLFNAILCLSQYLLQQNDAKTGKIPLKGSIIPKSGGKKFLYWENFLVNTWGGFICLPMIALGYSDIKPNIVYFLIFLVIMFISTTLKLGGGTLSDHKPNWAFPDDGTSLNAMLHVSYMSAFNGMGVICVLEILRNVFANKPVALPLYFALGGSLVCIILWLIDMDRGRYERLPIQEKDIKH